jgi:nucleoside phosphorylase
MASRIRTIAILSAMSSELKPVTRALGLDVGPRAGSGKARGIHKDVTVITAVTRMGLAAAQSATEELFASTGSGIDHVFVVGIAGANDPTLKIGEVVIPACVVDERDGVARYPTNLSDSESSGLIYSTDQLAYSKEFVAMLQDRKVSLVDMESGAIAAVCERNNCPFTIIRAVSDRVDKHAENFDVFHLANADGSPRYMAAMRYILGKPWKIFYLISMGLGARKAIKASSAELLKNVERLLSRD